MSTAEAWTVGRLLTWTTEYLKKNGSTSPRLDAEVLLANARKCERIELYTAFAEEPDEEVRTAFREMVRRRAEGSPVAYLVGHKEFYSMAFEVNQDVLIPRPETEHLVVEALDRAKQLHKREPDRALRIIDIGTGSGIIAVSLAKHLTNCKIWATDSSPAALVVAQRNAARHRVLELIEFAHSDLLTDVAEQERFDLILSNPPYISQVEYEKLARCVRDHEPRGALVSGPNGTEIIERLITEATDRIQPGGFLIVEISPMIADAAQSLVDRRNWNAPQFIKDLAGLTRIMTAQRLIH